MVFAPNCNPQADCVQTAEKGVPAASLSQQSETPANAEHTRTGSIIHSGLENSLGLLGVAAVNQSVLLPEWDGLLVPFLRFCCGLYNSACALCAGQFCYIKFNQGPSGSSDALRVGVALSLRVGVALSLTAKL